MRLDLPDRYRAILCDLWGCVHDGVRIFPAVEQRLRAWRSEGRAVVLITNAPRPALAVERQLATLGLSSDSYDSVATSGDAGIAAMNADPPAEPPGFIGTEADRAALAEAGLELGDGWSGDAVVCTGLTSERPQPEDWDEALRVMHARGARLLCFNPDLFVVRGGVPEPCAGAIARLYSAMGGRVEWFGKPHAPIYDHALSLAGAAAGDTVAIGDGLQTDFLGAARAGIDFVFIAGGVEAEEARQRGVDALLESFRELHGIASAQPVAVAERLC
jgi:HAD superfamily hydrolase (TIGR01459 family)